jgi:hypothetical protein
LVVHISKLGVSKSLKVATFGTRSLYMQYDGTIPLLTNLHIYLLICLSSHCADLRSRFINNGHHTSHYRFFTLFAPPLPLVLGFFSCNISLWMGLCTLAILWFAYIVYHIYQELNLTTRFPWQTMIHKNNSNFKL